MANACLKTSFFDSLKPDDQRKLKMEECHFPSY